MVYRIKIAGLERDLPLCQVNENLNIAAFILFGDVELTQKCAEALVAKSPECDVMITAESKGIPLIHEMSRIAGKNKYVLARKSVKVYMNNVIACDTKSITTSSDQVLYLDGADAEYMRGKRVLIIDDVVSTGGSLNSLVNLVEKAGGNIVGKMTILAEGDAAKRDDIVYLDTLPLFDVNGNPIDF